MNEQNIQVQEDEPQVATAFLLDGSGEVTIAESVIVNEN
jgi:hypothetical protein